MDTAGNEYHGEDVDGGFGRKDKEEEIMQAVESLEWYINESGEIVNEGNEIKEHERITQESEDIRIIEEEEAIQDNGDENRNSSRG